MLGSVEVVRILEWQGPFAPTAGLLPSMPAGLWSDNENWLAPEHWDPKSGMAVMALQTWVLRSGGRTIVIDTGMGNGHARPSTPAFDRWEGNLPGLLANNGIAADDVDVVVNTHLHVDHVGGNTIGIEEGWAPAFPRAQYLIPLADDAFFGPGNKYGNATQPDGPAIYEDSIAPIHRAGQAIVWEDFYRIDGNITLESAPGHTPGSSVLRLASGSDRAVFVGDLIHSPLQVFDPLCSSTNCLAPEQAALTRQRVLHRAADTGELMFPGHFAGPGAVEVRKEHGDLTLGAWADLSGRREHESS